MKRRSDNLVLYHAVSSYQLLEVLLHRLLFHREDRALLLLPDFITGKYPRYKKLVSLGLFDEVILFPYLQIPHREESAVRADAIRHNNRLIPHSLGDFSRIYVAGAHFYFTLCLLEEGIPFVFFEDAAGMLSRAEELYRTVAARFPIHAEIARRNGLFDGSNPLISRILCLESAQTSPPPGSRRENFSVEEALESLSGPLRKKLLRFFLRCPIRAEGDAILLTQHFANQGLMTPEQQKQLYRQLQDTELAGLRLIVKKHPDDILDYRDIFPDAQILREVFPAELLPYVFRKTPELLYTFDSTGC